MKAHNGYNSELGIIVSDMSNELSLSYFNVYYISNVSTRYFEAYSDCQGVGVVCFTQRFENIFEIVQAKKKKNRESFPVETYECES